MKKWTAALLALALVLCLSACGGRDREQFFPDYNQPYLPQPQATEPYVPFVPETTAPQLSQEYDVQWSVYWYLCGSDLETDHGCATQDLMELTSIPLPENVQVVIQTGGAEVWQNDAVEAGMLQRWLYNSEGLSLVYEEPAQNMGDAQTLYAFLDFANTNFPAEKTAVIFWNHGGGSVTGASFDQQFGFDSLTLAEMYSAFNAVWPADADHPALDLVGFDTCLMATVDVAAVFRHFAHYLVASQEVEPGNGWLYSGWLGALAEDPDMDGEEFGINICNTYYDGCEAVGTHEQATLSLTDLTQVYPLLQAYEMFGQEAFLSAAADPGFFAHLGRAAAQTENYGGNTREQGFTNMADLGHLARQTAWMLPSAQGVLDALEDCVLYQVGGHLRGEATGLSCYYSYNGDVNNLNGYIENGTGIAFKQLFAYGLTGRVDEEYLDSLMLDELPQVLTLDRMDWDDMPIFYDDYGCANLYLGPDAQDVLAGIDFCLVYYDPELDVTMALGTDDDIISDWENGLFTDNFRGVWGAIDGELVYMELSYQGDDYSVYCVPILLNGEAYILQVAYSFTWEEWWILGASQPMDDGMASKELRQLEEGDVITTIWYLSMDDGDFEPYEISEIVYSDYTEFSQISLFDGYYGLCFEYWDAQGNTASSEVAIFEVEDGILYNVEE